MVAKERFCRFCSKLLTADDSKSRNQCHKCNFTRSQHWFRLLAEAKQKFDAYWEHSD